MLVDTGKGYVGLIVESKERPGDSITVQDLINALVKFDPNMDVKLDGDGDQSIKRLAEGKNPPYTQDTIGFEKIKSHIFEDETILFLTKVTLGYGS